MPDSQLKLGNEKLAQFVWMHEQKQLDLWKEC